MNIRKQNKNFLDVEICTGYGCGRVGISFKVERELNVEKDSLHVDQNIINTHLMETAVSMEFDTFLVENSFKISKFVTKWSIASKVFI